MDGKILLKARKILGLSQEEMAAKLVTSYQTYNGYENGKKIPTTKHARINEIIKEAEERKANADLVINVNSTDVLNELLKEIKAVRRENNEIKGLLADLKTEYSDNQKLSELSSSQLDILKQIVQNLTKIEEKRKADLKSASTK